jgi:hypothetical protein
MNQTNVNDITMNDIQKAVADTNREEFMAFAKKDYWSVRQIASRFVARLHGRRVWTYQECLKEASDLSDILFPTPKAK